MAYTEISLTMFELQYIAGFLETANADYLAKKFRDEIARQRKINEASNVQEDSIISIGTLNSSNDDSNQGT